MKEKINLDKLFQEKFQDYEVEPSGIVWDNIEAILQKKKKRRVIPFWWKLSGVAAVFLIGLGLYNQLNSPSFNIPNNNNVVVNDTVKKNPEVKNRNQNKEEVLVNTENNKADKSNLDPTPNNGIANEENNSSIKNNDASKVNVNQNNAIVEKENTIVNNRKNISVDSNKNNALVQSNTNKKVLENNVSISNKNSAIVQSNSNKQNLENNNSVSNKNNPIAESNKKALVNSKSNKNQNTNNSVQEKLSVSNKGEVADVITNKKTKKNLEGKSISTDSNKNTFDKKTNSSNEQIVQNSNKETIQKDNIIVNSNIQNNQQEKNNSTNNQEVAVTKNEKEILKSDDLKIKDTTSVASVVPNALEELLNEKEAKKIVEQKINRWQITSSVAPIYFSSLSNGSPLDSSFVKNSKDFKTNISYGAGVTYALNKRIKVRTGINSVSFDYRTNDVVFYQNTNAKQIEHVDSNLEGSIIQVESKNSKLTSLEINPNGVIPNKFDSSINQKFGYIEIPLELSYKILDKKFGIEFIGGMSSMILNKNEIYLESDGLNLNIGEADNLNKMHFSSNIGLGFNYSFMKHFQANVEPTFKYQFNTFTNDAGNFKPYAIGIYSGISYTF